MNEQPAPQVPAVTPTDQEKELTDAAMQAANTGTGPDTPLGGQQSTNITTSQVDETTTPSSAQNNESAHASTDPISFTPQETEESAMDSPVVENPAPTVSTPITQIPVNDNTVITPDETTNPAPSESTQETTPNNPFAAPIETVNTIPLETQSTPTVEPSIPTQQPPAKPEGLMSKFLHIFKK